MADFRDPQQQSNLSVCQIPPAAYRCNKQIHPLSNAMPRSVWPGPPDWTTEWHQQDYRNVPGAGGLMHTVPWTLGLVRSAPIMCRTADAQEGRRKTEDGTTCHQRSWLDALFRPTTGRCGCLHCPTTSWRCALCTPYEYVSGLVFSCGPQVQFEANWTADYDLSQVPFSGSMAVQNFSMGSVSSPCLSGHDTPDHLLVIRGDVRIVFQHLPVHTITISVLSYYM